jgi:hypothetical protein
MPGKELKAAQDPVEIMVRLVNVIHDPAESFKQLPTAHDSDYVGVTGLVPVSVIGRIREPIFPFHPFKEERPG